MRVADLERRQALITLLSIPDTPDLRRGHHLTMEGRPDRHLIVAELAANFIQWHRSHADEWSSEAEATAYTMSWNGAVAVVREPGIA
jgi:hypothetical protein